MEKSRLKQGSGVNVIERLYSSMTLELYKLVFVFHGIA